MKWENTKTLKNALNHAASFRENWHMRANMRLQKIRSGPKFRGCVSRTRQPRATSTSILRRIHLSYPEGRPGEKVFPIQKRSVGKYLGLYGVVKFFNDRPGESTLRAYRERKKPRKRERGKEREAGNRGQSSQSSKCRFNIALTAFPWVHVPALLREDIAIWELRYEPRSVFRDDTGVGLYIDLRVPYTKAGKKAIINI